MQRFKIEVDETRVFRHEFVIDAENEDELNSVLDAVEAENILGIEDYEFALREKCRVVENVKDEDGDLKEIECTDLDGFHESEDI